MNIEKGQVMEEIYPGLEWEGDFWIYNDREENWKEVEEEDNKERVKVHALSWEVYMKDKEKLIMMGF